MTRFFPISIGVGAGIGLVLGLALYGMDGLVWGMLAGAALGVIGGLIGSGKPQK